MGSEMAKALVAAQAAAKRVINDARNNFHGYDYASSEAVIDAARATLAAHGIAVSARGWTHDAAGLGTPYGKAVHGGRICVSYEVSHVSGETDYVHTSTPIMIESGRPPDKAEAAALTLNLAYFLRGLLLLSRGDADDDVHARDDRDEHDAQQDSAESSAKYSAFRHDIEACQSEAALAELGLAIKRAADGGEISPNQRGQLAKMYKVRHAALAPT